MKDINKSIGEIGTKKCCGCKQNLSTSFFGVDRSRKDGAMVYCKSCVNKRYQLLDTNSKAFKDSKKKAMKKFLRTQKGIATQLFQKHKESSKNRGHPPPNYSLNVLQDWCLQNKRFTRLYNEWVASGYQKQKKPGIDRIDPRKGYSLDNIQVMTWEENRFKQRWELTFLEGKKTYKISNGVVIAVYPSVKKAAESVGGFQSNIRRSCLNPKMKSMGFNWSFSPC